MEFEKRRRTDRITPFQRERQIRLLPLKALEEKQRNTRLELRGMMEQGIDPSETMELQEEIRQTRAAIRTQARLYLFPKLSTS